MVMALLSEVIESQMEEEVADRSPPRSASAQYPRTPPCPTFLRWVSKSDCQLAAS